MLIDMLLLVSQRYRLSSVVPVGVADGMDMAVELTLSYTFR